LRLPRSAVAFCWPALSRLFFNAAKMSTTLACPPWRRRDGFDFLAFHFFLDAAVNDRLLFDFPHNVRCLFIFSQPDKGRVSQMTVWRPLSKLYLGDQFRL